MGTKIDWMEHKAKGGGSALFVLNVWKEEVCPGHIEWRGRVLNVDTNELNSFHDWPELVEMVAVALSQSPLQVEPVEHSNKVQPREIRA